MRMEEVNVVKRAWGVGGVKEPPPMLEVVVDEAVTKVPVALKAATVTVLSDAGWGGSLNVVANEVGDPRNVI